MVDWSLASSPLAVRIGHGWVLGQHTADRPVEQVWVVDKSLGVEGVIVQHDGAVRAQTATDTPNDEVANPAIGKPASDVEVLDGQFTDDGEAKDYAQLRSGCVVCPVEV